MNQHAKTQQRSVRVLVALLLVGCFSFSAVSGQIQKADASTSAQSSPAEPDAPTDLSVSSSGVVSGVLSNANGGLVRARIEVARDSQLVWSGTSGWVTSGQTFSAEIPTSLLTDDRGYDVSVHTYNAASLESTTATEVRFAYAVPSSAPATPSALAAGPRDGTSSVLSATPTLKAHTSDPNTSDTVTVKFRIKDSGGVFWEGESTVAASGDAYITVPKSANLRIRTSYSWSASAQDSSGLSSASSAWTTIAPAAFPTSMQESIDEAATYVVSIDNPGTVLADGAMDEVLWKNTQAGISACMAEKGYTYGPMAYPLQYHSTPSLTTGYGVSDTGAIPAPVPAASTASYIGTATTTQLDGYFKALKGVASSRDPIVSDGATAAVRIGSSTDTAGCESLVRDRIVRPALETWDTAAIELNATLDSVESDQDYIDNMSDWSSCMNAAGYTFKDYRDPLVTTQAELTSGGYSNSQLRTRELATATSDHDCRASSGLANFFRTDEPELANTAMRAQVESPSTDVDALLAAASGANALR
jgi:hypothetical protein